MTTYPPADTRAAWYQDNYPGAVMDPNCGVLHTTEGTSLPGYSGGATAPNYTAVPDFSRKRLRWFAHFPDERSSRALRNLGGGVETNTANVVQVELVGTCDPGTRDRWKREGRTFIFWPDAPEWALDDLAEFIAWMHKAHGIKISGPRTWAPYPSSYANGAGQRFSFAQWRSFYGWCGHQHVPENTHGDPGSLPWGRVAAKARALVAPEPDQPTQEGVTYRPLVIDLSVVQGEFRKANAGKPVTKRAYVRRVQRALRDRYPEKFQTLKTDGLVGRRTLRAWAYHERLVGGGKPTAGRPRIPDEESLKALIQPTFRMRK